MVVTESSDQDIGCCGMILVAFSYVLVLFTFPFSLCLCIKVSSRKLIRIFFAKY